MVLRAVMVASRIAALAGPRRCCGCCRWPTRPPPYITVWAAPHHLVMVAGYAVAEAGLQFGLPWSAYDSILRICMLRVTLFLVIVILQNRHAVSDALRAPPLREDERPTPTRRFFRALRDRAAEIWHFLAIAWLVAAWGVWALEVRGGFWRLSRVSLFTLLVAGTRQAHRPRRAAGAEPRLPHHPRPRAALSGPRGPRPTATCRS